MKFRIQVPKRTSGNRHGPRVVVARPLAMPDTKALPFVTVESRANKAREWFTFAQGLGDFNGLIG
jgi:hypothetical protein